MSRQPAAKRGHRLQEIAHDVGAVLGEDFDPTPLQPPNQLPSWMNQEDERAAESILSQVRGEDGLNKQPSLVNLTAKFSKGTKSTAYSYGEMYQAMLKTIKENKGPGVLEALIRRFRGADGDINISKKASTSALKRVRGKEEQDERGFLLELATRNGRHDFVQLLAPLSDEKNLNDALNVALSKRDMDVIETLVRYGADAALFETAHINGCSHDDYGLLDILLRSRRRVGQSCMDQCLLPAATRGSLYCILLLTWAGANTDHNGGAALLRAVEAERLDLTAALLTARKPPSGVSINKALHELVAQPTTPAPSTNGQFTLMEALLCGGPEGDAASNGLVRATTLANLNMMDLLLSHQVDINFDGGAAVGYTIHRNRLDLLDTLLQHQSLKPEIASKLAHQIPAKTSSADRVAILSKLLLNGASGAQCSEQLIHAAESNDLETAQLLVHFHAQTDGHPVCSVDYNGARCLKVAVARNNIELVKLLAIEGKPSKFSLAQAFSAIPPNLSGDDHFLIVQTLLRGGAAGEEVDEELRNAVSSNKKAHRLIEVLVQYKAKVTEETILAAISQGSTTILDSLLKGEVVPAVCIKAIKHALKLPVSRGRFNIIEKLLGPVASSTAEIPEVSQAAIEILKNTPEDLDLLDLLCRHGKVNPNHEDGLALMLAIKLPDPRLLQILLQPGTPLPSEQTIEKALESAIKLPITDVNRHEKVKVLLWKVKPQEAINKAFVAEIDATMKHGQYSPMIDVLLEKGADVNAEDGKALQLAVTNPALMGHLLSKKPSVQSLSNALPAALKLKDPARVKLCQRLLQAGATGDEINKALCMIVEEGPAALPLMHVLIPHADTNYNDGQALRLAVQNGFSEGHDLLLNSRVSGTSPATRAIAFEEAIKLKDAKERYNMAENLLRAGVSREMISDALITAVDFEDFQLSQLLLQKNASVDHKGGQAIGSAASAGNIDLLALLVASEPSIPSLFAGFHGALALTGEPYFQVLQTLLEAGMRGEAVDDALIETVKKGDSGLRMTEILCKNGASIDWKDGEAIVVAAGSASIRTLDLLLAREPSQATLARAYAAASKLPREKLITVLDKLLEAGKEIDEEVTKSLTKAAKEVPPDLAMIKMLLNRDIFDEGQAMMHAAKTLDFRTLSVLVNSPRASEYTPLAFESVEINDELWKSKVGLSVISLLLNHEASGPGVGEALCQAVMSLESPATSDDTLVCEFIDAFMEADADVNYKKGLALQRATLQANIPLITKLLPGANAESKAMAIPYVFTVCDNKVAVLETLSAFSDSFEAGDEVDIMFRHPDEDLEPVLFMAMSMFPRDRQILETLLEMGFPANQWQFCQGETDHEPEKWPILCWALEQPEKKISTTLIEMLIDAGADVKYTSKTGVTPLFLAVQNQRVDIVAKLIARGVSVAVEDPNGMTPLAMATAMNNIPLMEALLEADSEIDDGSLHDCARQLKIDKMRLLIKYGHRANYPSDRHDGRSALAELCYKAVDNSPSAKQLEKCIQFLIAHNAKVTQKNVIGKTIFHYALDSSNPVLILTAMLKILWEHVNDDKFLYITKEYTYSLTKYVEKDLYLGPKEQKADILALLRKKQTMDRFWATDLMSTQPDDYCNGPPHIEDEVIRQKARVKRQLEMKEEAAYALEMKRLAAEGENEVLAIAARGEWQRMQERAKIEKELLESSAITRLQLTEDEWTQTKNFQDEARRADILHQRQLGDVQIQVARKIREEGAEGERGRNMMQIEYLDKKIEMENSGYRQRLQIEEQGAEGLNRVSQKEYEREMQRMKVQKQILGQQQNLASNFSSVPSYLGASGGSGSGGGSQRQITSGFVSEDL